MTLQEHIDDIRDNLEKSLFTSEAARSTGIVLRLLDALNWPTFNPQVIMPEYSVGGGRVDFALCHPSSKPLIFIEVKQPETLEGGEKQLFEYAFHEGVPIVILTDGQKWRFFHPIGEGDYRERKVYELDLIKNNIEESVERLNRYLNYESIRTGEGVEAIKADYEEVVRQRQVTTRLPEAWSKLVEETDEFLIDIVAEKTESLCKYRPTDEQVLDFLKSLKRETELDRRETSAPSVQPTQPRPRRKQTRLVVTMPNRHKIEDRNASNTFCEVIEEIGIEIVSSFNLRLCAASLITPIGDWQEKGYKLQKRKSKCGRYYITTHGSVKTLADKLKEIAEKLEGNMTVEIIAKS
ncbi:MAG: hypothetical protein OXN25_09145 [Candidatus Poribacteria bacterium]|nr:hypothetical protein [Candidatus Poribacteria bacterium]